MSSDESANVALSLFTVTQACSLFRSNQADPIMTQTSDLSRLPVYTLWLKCRTTCRPKFGFTCGHFITRLSYSLFRCNQTEVSRGSNLREIKSRNVYKVA